MLAALIAIIPSVLRSLWRWKKRRTEAPPPANLGIGFAKANRFGKVGGGGMFTGTISNDIEATGAAQDIEVIVDGKPISEHPRFRMIEEIPEDLVLAPAQRCTFRIDYSPSEPYKVDSVVAFVRWTDADGQHDGHKTAFPSEL